MADDERRIATIFGLLGALLLVLEGLIELVTGAFLLAVGRGWAAFGAWEHAVLVLVVGVIVGLFAAYGRSRAADRSLAAGIVLVVIALVGWLALGLTAGLAGVLGTLLVLISGILFLIVRH
jgi:hypothetical protein